MKCEHFEQRLHALLDQRKPPELDEPLQLHAQQCPPCRRALKVQREILIGTRHCLAVPLRPIRERGSKGLDLLAPLAAACIVLVLAAAAWNNAALLSQQKNVQLAHRPAAATSQAATSRPTTGGSAELTVGTAHEPLAEVLDWQRFAGWLPHDQAPALGRGEWIESVAGGLKPLTDSVTSTWNVLRRTIAGTRPSSDGSPQANRTKIVPPDAQV